ncbi:MAG: hypothetical protein F6K54_27420, partial [Okeania sp. SIO3B5]|nr:hypothetical protein [Okeania sp. SIO3B5]
SPASCIAADSKVGASGKRLVVVGSYDHSTKVFDASNDTVIELQDSKEPNNKSHSASVMSVAILTQGDNCTIVTGGYDKKVKVWQQNPDSMQSNKWKILELKDSKENNTAHGLPVVSVVINAKSKDIVTVDQDNTVKIWQYDLGTNTWELNNSGSTVNLHNSSDPNTHIPIENSTEAQKARIWSVTLPDRSTIAGSWDDSKEKVEKVLQFLRLQSNPFSDQLAHLRLYDRCLPQQEILANIDKDFRISNVGSSTIPLEFDLQNADGDTVLYLNNSARSSPQQLILTLKNTSSQTVRLPSSHDTELTMLELQFRPGTLSKPDRVSLAGVTLSGTPLNDDQNNWNLRHISETDGTDSFHISRTAQGTSIAVGGTIAFTLNGFTVDHKNGSRATRVQLRYALETLSDRAPLSGSRQHYLSLVPLDATGLHTQLTTLTNKTQDIVKATSTHDLTLNQLRADLNQLAQVVYQVASAENKIAGMVQQLENEPIVAGVVGSATILNDGKSNNEVQIYVSNVTNDQLTFDTGSKVHFEIFRYDSNVRPWGLLTDSNGTITSSIVENPTNWKISSKSESNHLLNYTVTPKLSLNHKLGIFLTVKFILTSSAANGSGYVRVRYEGVKQSGKADPLHAHMIVPIQRTHILIPDPSTDQAANDAHTVVAGKLEMVDTPILTFRNGSYQETNSEESKSAASISLKQEHTGKTKSLAIESVTGITLKSSGSDEIELLSKVKSTEGFIGSLIVSDGEAKGTRQPSQKRGIYYQGHPGHLVPTGAIMMWSGTESDIPQGWALCDGTNGTPDLRGRFLVGAGNQESEYTPKQQGGSNSITLTQSQMPQHKHTVKIDDPGHGHSLFKLRTSSTDDDDSSLKVYARDSDAWIWDTEKATTGLTVQLEDTGESQPFDNRPPFYALCFIMKL